jgi:hypothetical protein
MSILYVNFWAGVNNGMHFGFMGAEEIDYTAGVANVAVPGDGQTTIVAELYTDADVHWRAGESAVADTSSSFLAEGERMTYPVTGGLTLSAISGA